MLEELADALRTRGISLSAASPHGQVRDLLRAEGLEGKILGISRGTALEDLLT